MSAHFRSEHPDPRSILVVPPTWVGDFVMATPALRAIRERFGDAHITFLMEPNLRGLVSGGGWMNECVEWPVKAERSPLHRAYRDVVWDLRRRRFDWAILFPNSFRAAMLARIIGAKRRIGYDRDGRGFLLTDRVPCKNRRSSATRRPIESEPGAQATGQLKESNASRSRIESDAPPTTGHAGDSAPPPLKRWATRQVESEPEARAMGRSSESIRTTGDGETSRGLKPAARGVRVGTRLPVRLKPFAPMPMVEYYGDLVMTLGCAPPGDRFELFTAPAEDRAVAERLTALGIADHHPLVVISPGAKYGASKCWPPERFAELSDRLIADDGAAVVITCGPGEEPIARRIASRMKERAIVLDTPLLTLGELKSLVRRGDLMVCNDAGPRHIAKAFGVPVVTVFGPTHPDWTATDYEAERVVRIDIDCGPCQQRVCPLRHLDCMTGVTVDMVFAASRDLLRQDKRMDSGEDVQAAMRSRS